MTGKLPEIGSGAMHIRVASHMMHPRDTLEAAPQRKRVLKSVVRRRDTHNTNQVELHERNRAALATRNASDPMTIEAPFAVDLDRNDMNNNFAPPIFSTDQCQVPYTTDEMEVDRGGVGYASPSKVRREYRPSSPQSDDE
jgi:hypothetical protein